MEGVLKSWAVPKGPSEDPADKRLAVMTEDHPVSYGKFEGTIPKGEYGGGKVEIWDHGTWEPIGDASQGLKKGDLKFRLKGKRLNGRWVLVRMHGRAGEGDKNWLLIKEKDEAPAEDWHEKRRRVVAARGRAKKVSVAKKTKASPLPADFRPELATLVESVPTGDDWIHETKFDGYRLLAFLDDGAVRLQTRNGLDWTDKFPAIAESVKSLPIDNAILDGEVVVQSKDGTTSFQRLQNFLKGREKDTLTYQVFDLPFLSGHNLTQQPLIERKAALEKLLSSQAKASRLRYSAHTAGNGQKMFEKACRAGMEGIISKAAQSPYAQRRTPDWVKVKCKKGQEFVIGGYTEPKGSRDHFGSLLLGFYDEQGKLVYCGNVGTGFDQTTLSIVWNELRKRKVTTSPFHEKIVDPMRREMKWVKPELVAQIAFSQWTDGRHLRHPVFEGLRDDKKPTDVKMEKVESDVKDAAPTSSRDEKARARVEKFKRQKTGSEEEVAGVRLTHPDRVIYPEQKITKRDLARYYEAVAERMLPFVKGRPLSLLRCPQGSGKECFYQKHLTDLMNKDFLRGIDITETDSHGTYVMVDDVKGLVYLAQIGVLEIHPWGSTEDNLEKPDIMVLDMDPGPGVPWKAVVKAAFDARQLFSKYRLKSFVKTTGGKGLHVVVPVEPQLDWDTFKALSKRLAEVLVEENPTAYTSVMAKAKREKKIFLDYLRNGRGATAVAPFSTRAREGAPVSMPLSWEELKRGVTPADFTVRTVPTLLTKKDPWKDFFTTRQRIKKI